MNFEPDEQTKKKIDEMTNRLPNGQYVGICPGCSAEVRLSINAAYEVFRGCLMVVTGIVACLVVLRFYGYF